MYTGYGFRPFEIGDVDVVKHNGVYHLFHLILPNHDYIAHAVSQDGLNWQRVKNALFISDPPAWDDDMLWTMHISPNPYKKGWWRMFYTGLSMSERGRVQRVGLAHSNDLYNWEKDNSSTYPLEISNQHYEHSVDEGRHWVSFRDPLYFQDDGRMYLLAAARANKGPVIRRGCVSLAEEISENQFKFRPPLFHPMRYDDIEVPTVLKLQDRYYLIGSIREDVKVHYWYADQFTGPYYNFFDNVLLPQGNYAARVCKDGDKFLIWNFFFKGLTTKGEHLLAPPKELVVNSEGELQLKSFAGFNNLVEKKFIAEELAPVQQLFDNPDAVGATKDLTCWFGCDSGFEAFFLQDEHQDFRLTGELNMEGRGKCGLVFRIDDEGDGYYLSLDLFKGIVQLRAWKHKPEGFLEEAFYYEQLQAAHYVPVADPHPFCLVVHEQYIEFSLHGHVLLTLADNHFENGRVGFYVESARIRIDNLTLETLQSTHPSSYPKEKKQE